MTVESQTVKVVGEGNDAATVFSFSPMVIYASTQLLVTHVDGDGVETELSEGTGASAYAVTVTSFPGTGSVTYPEDEVTPMAAGESIIIKRVLPLTQLTDLENQGGYFPDTQEDVADKATMIDLQQQEEIDRAIKVPISESAVNLELPDTTTRANKALVFDGTGAVTVGNTGSSGLANVVEDTTPQLGGDLDVNGNNITMTGAETVDGRDVSADGTKLDGIESNADVTDAANVNAAGAVMESDYNANTVLAATSDNTPAALTVGEQTLVGRITSGNIAALTSSQVRTLINVEDGATADQSAAEILTAIKTVDGTGTGLDADLLDGQEAAEFSQLGQIAGINSQLDDYTLVLGDVGKTVQMTKVTATTLTVPLNSSVAYPTGTAIHVLNYGAGQVTVAATGGVTIHTPATLLLRAQYSMATLLKIGTDEWMLTGDLEAA